MATALKNPPFHADASWKRALDQYFSQFLHFFVPDIAEQINWAAGYERLDAELQKITTQSMSQKQLLDKLVKVRAKTGKDYLLLLHTEIQASHETHFAERLYTYSYRLRDHYHLPVLTLAILADDRASWRPECYQQAVLGHAVLDFKFIMRKLLDYRGKEAALLEEVNPFGIMVAAHLASLATRSDPEARYAHKFALTRQFYEKGWGKDDILNLYYFVDGVLTLPENLEIRYNESLLQLEKEKQMEYVTSGQRISKQQGIQQGIQQGQHDKALEIAAQMFKKGFKVSDVKECTGLDNEDLSAWISVH
jgi:hypothetical protein